MCFSPLSGLFNDSPFGDWLGYPRLPSPNNKKSAASSSDHDESTPSLDSSSSPDRMHKRQRGEAVNTIARNSISFLNHFDTPCPLDCDADFSGSSDEIASRECKRPRDGDDIDSISDQFRNKCSLDCNADSSSSSDEMHKRQRAGSVDRTADNSISFLEHFHTNNKSFCPLSCSSDTDASSSSDEIRKRPREGAVHNADVDAISDQFHKMCSLACDTDASSSSNSSSNEMRKRQRDRAIDLTATNSVSFLDRFDTINTLNLHSFTSDAPSAEITTIQHKRKRGGSISATAIHSPSQEQEKQEPIPESTVIREQPACSCEEKTAASNYEEKSTVSTEEEANEEEAGTVSSDEEESLVFSDEEKSAASSYKKKNEAVSDKEESAASSSSSAQFVSSQRKRKRGKSVDPTALDLIPLEQKKQEPISEVMNRPSEISDHLKGEALLAGKMTEVYQKHQKRVCKYTSQEIANKWKMLSQNQINTHKISDQN